MGVFGGIPYYQRFFNLKKSFQVGEHKANFMKGIHIRCKYKIATENYIYIYTLADTSSIESPKQLQEFQSTSW